MVESALQVAAQKGSANDRSFSWMIGGPQGSGVDSSANILIRAFASGGLSVFGSREYHSNIMGLHSYFQVRVAEVPIHSYVNRVDLLATIEEETLVRHAWDVVPGGGIIYDPGWADTKIDDLESLFGTVVMRIKEMLKEKGLDETVNGVLKHAEGRSVKLYPVPYRELIAQLAAHYPETQLSRMNRMVNVAAVASSLALVGFDKAYLVDAIKSVFRTKPAVAEMNVYLADITYDKVRSTFGDGFGRTLRGRPSEKRLLLMGSQAVALGKILGGCRFKTYYPITPASDESEFLEANETFDLIEESSGQKKGSIVVVQTEDEIAAITMATGAALAGARAATSTSGPGFSLMMEGMGWAGMNEVPVVVTLYQRAGPSTGMPTRHEQGDLRFAIHAGQGEFPRIVIASSDIAECIYDAASAMNYAERYQLPVIHIVDKALANTNDLVPFPDYGRIRIERGKLIESGGYEPLPGVPYKRFEMTKDGISPRARLGTKGAMFWNTGDEHDELGHIDEDPVDRNKMMEKRMNKLKLVDKEVPLADRLSLIGSGAERPEALAVSWGSTKGAVLDAIGSLASQGHAVDLLQVKMLHPFPAEQVREILSRYTRRIDVEMNYSAQLAGIIAEKTRIGMDNYVLKYNGRPMSENEVHDALMGILQGSAPEKVVLTNGA